GLADEVVELHASLRADKFTPPSTASPRAVLMARVSDEELRALERRVELEPSDEGARVAYGLALVRAGRALEAATFLRPESAVGYAALVRAAAGEPGLDRLLDDAPEWRVSGGDA